MRNPRIFDAKGCCVIPLREVKRILKISIRYDEEAFHIRRMGREWRFSREDYASPWTAIRERRWMAANSFKERAKEHMRGVYK